MKLVKTVEKNKLLSSDWGIYELSNEEQKKFGGRYALVQGIFSDYAIEEMGVDKLLSELREFYYEGFHATLKEAELTVALVAMKSKIDRYEIAVREAYNISKVETPTW